MNKLFMPAIAAATVALSFTCVGADTPVEQYSGTISIPGGTTYRMSALTNYSAATFSLSGGTLDVNGQTGPAKALSVGGTTVSMITNTGDSAATVTYASGSGISYTASHMNPNLGLHIAGGRHVFPSGVLSLEGYSSSACGFELSGDDTYVSIARNGTGYLGNQGNARLDIRGGQLVLTGAKPLYVASADTSTFTLNVSGGKFSATDILECRSGTINFNLTGGTFAPSYLRMGNRGSVTTTKKTHTLTMTGGRLEIESEFCAPKSDSTYADCTVNLNGGVAKVVHIRSNTTPNATSTFTADGGTLQTRSVQSSYFYGFKTALLGEQGLTFQADHAITVSQKFTGLKEGAAYGTIVKNGTAALTLSGALCDGVRFENREGATTLTATSGAVRVTVTAGSVTLTDKGKFGANSELVVNNGGTLTLNGPVDSNSKIFANDGILTLNSSVGANSELAVNNGSTLTLNGPVDPTTTVSVSDGTLAINVSTTFASLTLGSEAKRVKLALGESAELIVTGEVTGDLAKSLFYYSDYDYIVTKDDSGRTHIVRDLSPAKTLEIRLDEEGATSNATESLTFKGGDTLAVSVARDATLTMSGLYGRGKLEKSGAGAAVLTNPDNFFAGGVTCQEGRLTANPFSAFGLAAATPLLTLVNGTVELQGDEPVTYAGTFKVNATNSTAAVIIKTDTDVTLKSITHTQGAIIKRGVGCLTIDPQNRSGTAMVLSRSEGVNGESRTPQTFDDANGTVPTKGYCGFNVAEGELRLANGNFNLKAPAMIGMPLTAEPAAPVVLTITNSDVIIRDGGSKRFYIGGGLKEGDFGQTVRVNVIDSTLSGDSALCVGGWGGAQSTSPDARVYLSMTNSIIKSSWVFVLNNNNNASSKTYLNASNTQFSGGGFILNGPAESVLDGCVYCGKTGEGSYASGPAPTDLGPDSGWTKFTGGSKAYINVFGSYGGSGGGSLKHSVIFDNAIWYVDTLVKLNWAKGYDINYYLKTEGAGVTIPVSSGTTCRNAMRLQGTGGLTKTGAGTFFFGIRGQWGAGVEYECPEKVGRTTWNFTGPVDIQEGVLAVTNGAIAATMSPTVHIAEGATWQMRGDVALANVTVSGCGTVEGGALTDPTVKVEWKDGKPGNGPVFAGTLAGTATVDFGRTEDNPLGRDSQQCTVARWTGVKPTNVKFRAVNTGLRSKGHFTVNDDGTITADLRPMGMILFVR